MRNARLLVLMAVSLLLAAGLSAQNGSWNWANNAGGPTDDTGMAIARDSQGYLYICGSFTGQASFGSTVLTCAGAMGTYVAKLAPDGTWLWAKQTNGTGSCSPSSIGVDGFDQVYLCGGFSGAVDFGIYQLDSFAGSSDIFVAKIGPSGEWAWAQHGGGNGMESARSLDVDPDGNVYLGGSFTNTAYFGAVTLSSPVYGDIVIAGLDSNGNWVWAKQAGGENNWDECLGVTQSGPDLYATGYFYGTAAFGDTTLTCIGNKDIFVTRLEASSGTWMDLWQAGSSSADIGTSLCLDGSGNVYLAGYAGGSVTFGNLPGSVFGGYLAKLDAFGDWAWARQIPNYAGADYRIALNPANEVLVGGSFSGVPYFGDTYLIPHAGQDIFVACMNPAGSWLWAKAAGSNSDDGASGVAPAPDGSVYLTGTFRATCEFDALSLVSAGTSDAFVARFSLSTPVNDAVAQAAPPLRLGKVSPNPFAAASSLQVLADKDFPACELAVYDLKGRKVGTVFCGALERGEHSFDLGAMCQNLGSGIYYACLSSGGIRQLTRMVILK